MNQLSLKTSIAVLCLLVAFTAKAQRQIVRKAIVKIQSAKNISYNDTENGMDFFDSEVHHQNYFNFFGYQDSTFTSYRVESLHGKDKFKYFFDGQKQLDLRYQDSTYTISEPQKRLWISPLHELAANLKNALAKSSYAVVQLADSTINKTPCYHLFIHSEKDAKKGYDRYHIFISKRDYLILASLTDLKGELSKGGMVVGTFSRKIDYIFSDIYISKYDPKEPVTIDIPAGFQPEKKLPMLANGSSAPQWALTSTDGKTLSLADLKGKVVLMEFTFNGCAACMLALPALEKMHQKYDGTNVAIVSVNYLDNQAAVNGFITKNKVKNPIYLGSRALAKTYQVSAGPTFYLINKNGAIDWSSAGFFEDFDRIVTEKIEALR